MKKLTNSVDKFVDKCVYPVENSDSCVKVEKKNLYKQFYQHHTTLNKKVPLNTFNTIHRHYYDYYDLLYL